MTATYDVVVIGAGAFGASTAYHLAKAGLRVALVDRFGVATQTSARAAGLTSQAQQVEVFARLEALSVAALERFTEETGEPLEVHRAGSLKLARTESDDATLDDDVRICRGYGIDVDRISIDDACALAPWLRPGSVIGATYAPTDVYVEEPGPLPLGYAAAALRLGADIIVASVTGIDGTRVTTDVGELSAGVVVDTAGAWARRVAGLAGVRVPLVPVRHQLLVTEPLDEVRAGQPICRVIDANVYVRPCRGGLMLGGYEAAPRVLPDDGPGDHFDVADLELDRSVLDGFAVAVRDELPVFSSRIGVQDLRGGLPTMTPDGLPFIGAVPGADGMYVAAGCCVFGLSISPAAGAALAGLVTGGEPGDGLDLTPLRLDRFADWTDVAVRRAALDVYGHRYAAPASANH